MNTILFDLDGTLSDPKIGITTSVAYALEKFDIKVDDLDDLSTFIGPPLLNSFIEFYDLSDSQAERAISYYRERFSTVGLYENIIYDGVKEMLEKLKQQNKQLIVATSKPTVFAVKILSYFQILEYFTFVAGSELDGSRSNKADVISYALNENKIDDLSDVVMVGDRKHDIIGAKTIGIKSIGVLYGYGNEEELSSAGSDIIVSNVAELTQCLLEDR